MNLTQIIKRPLITEKSMREIANGRYSFLVAKAANSRQIAQTIENSFGVHVIKVNTSIVGGKTRRITNTRRTVTSEKLKKATVQLKEGEKIGAFETGE